MTAISFTFEEVQQIHCNPNGPLHQKCREMDALTKPLSNRERQKLLNELIQLISIHALHKNGEDQTARLKLGRLLLMKLKKIPKEQGCSILMQALFPGFFPSISKQGKKFERRLIAQIEKQSLIPNLLFIEELAEELALSIQLQSTLVDSATKSSHSIQMPEIWLERARHLHWRTTRLVKQSQVQDRLELEMKTMISNLNQSSILLYQALEKPQLPGWLITYYSELQRGGRILPHAPFLRIRSDEDLKKASSYFFSDQESLDEVRVLF